MIQFSDMLERELDYLPDSIHIRSVHFAPINKDGRAVSCFTPFHIGYPDRSVQDGNHLETLCWYAAEYAVSVKYRRGSKNLQAIGDCKTCKFCLNKASSYFLALSIDSGNMNQAEIGDIIKPILIRVSKQLNKPLKTVTIYDDSSGETWDLTLEVK